MLETVLGQLLGFIGFAIRERIGHMTGKAVTQGLAFGRLFVAEPQDFRKSPFLPSWQIGRQRMVSGWVAKLVGYACWIGAAITSIVLLRS
jgi:hypothetical protein